MMSPLTFRLVMIILLALPSFAVGQLVVIVDDYPAYTPPDESLFLSGSINDWEAGHYDFRFTKQPDGTYVYQFEDPVPGFEFKITRGSWTSSECKIDGGRTPNRSYRPIHTGEDTLFVAVENWWDLRDSIPYFEKLTLRIVEVPNNTPQDANLYVAGTFNGWATYDEKYLMDRQDDGSYTVEIPIRLDTTEYKFNRGDWQTVEGRPNGLARRNRKYIRGVHSKANVQALVVESWEDLANRFSWYSLFILLAVLQSFLLVLAINSFENQNRRANLIFSILILLMSATFLARLWAFRGEVFHEFPKLFLFPDLIYFLYGPLLFLYMRSLLALPKKGWRQNVIHFIPAILLLAAYFPLIRQENQAFIDDVNTLVHKPYFITASLLGALYSSYYWVRSFWLLQSYRKSSERNYSFDPNISFLQTVLIINAACLIVWLATFIVGALGRVLQEDWTSITDMMVDTVWVMIAVTVYAMGYYVMRQPQIFQLIDLDEEEEEPLEDAGEVDEENRELSSEEQQEYQRLAAIMEDEQPFLNPRLTLPELAALIELPIHQLSRIINEGYGKNFFDFVNSYRVEAFKQRIAEGGHEQQTLLSIALEVGFNSKTAFNRAFKKHAQTTPREYLKTLVAEED